MWLIRTLSLKQTLHRDWKKRQIRNIQIFHVTRTAQEGKPKPNKNRNRPLSHPQGALPVPSGRGTEPCCSLCANRRGVAVCGFHDIEWVRARLTNSFAIFPGSLYNRRRWSNWGRMNLICHLFAAFKIPPLKVSSPGKYHFLQTDAVRDYLCRRTRRHWLTQWFKCIYINLTR